MIHEKKISKFIIAYDLSTEDINTSVKNYLKESRSKYDSFETEIYKSYPKVNQEKKLPDTTILISSYKNSNEISKDILKKFKAKYNIKRFCITEYSEIIIENFNRE